MRYDLREPEWRGEAVITRRGRAVKAVAIPDPDNFSRGVSPWMLCVGGAEAGCVVFVAFTIHVWT